MSISFLGNTVRAGATVNAATSGAVPLTCCELYTTFSTNNTANITATLPDGQIPGQLKIIELVSRDTNDLVVTFDGEEGDTLTFNASNEFALLVWGVAKWHVIYSNADISTAA